MDGSNCIVAPKAVILAAGMGSRLGNYTRDIPKCLLQFCGRSLIEHQVSALRSAGVHDISVVRGYQGHKIKIDGVKYFDNPLFDSTNMVATLMAAEAELITAVSGVLVCYADIIYQDTLVRKLLNADADINVLVDDDWLDYWQARSDNWQSDIESLQYDSNDRLTEIGTPGCSLDKARSRYIGLIKFTRLGISHFLSAYKQNFALNWNNPAPWRRSRSFRTSFMTCMLQELIERGVNARVVHTRRGWMEFDTVEDYQRARRWHESGELHKFICISEPERVESLGDIHG